MLLDAAFKRRKVSLSACHVLRRPDGRVFYEHIPTRKQQWRTPDELKGREEAEALPAVN